MTKEEPTTGAPTVSIREAQFSDFERVCELNRSLGQGPDSTENWRRLWVDNPALADGKGPSPIGWALEASGQIVGFLGSIPLQYEFQGTPLRAAATCRFAVETVYRASSHLLVMSFFRQKNVDLFLNTTATPAAGKIVAALKALPVPQPDYGAVLFWVLAPRRFSKEALSKFGVRQPFAGAGSALAALALQADRMVRGRKPRTESRSYSARELGLAEIGSDFERFWVEYSRGTKELFASRTPQLMRWHFDPPHNRRTVSVFASYRGNELSGYLIVRHDAPDAEGFRRSVVADLLVKPGDQQMASEIIEPLFAAALASAESAGSDVLELLGFPTRIRNIFLQWKPYRRQYPACPFFYKTRDAALREKLANESSWYASPFDGDATLWP